MATRVNMHQAKTNLSQLVAKALLGEDVVITRSGKPVARLVPIYQQRVPGLARGRIHIGDDFDSPLPEDILDDFEG